MIRLLLVLCGVAILFASCDSLVDAIQNPRTVLRSKSGFKVVSQPHRYSQETGGRVEYAVYAFHLNGQKVDNETISSALFPKQETGCGSHYYTVSDIRLLPNNAVLALMSQMSSSCEAGGIFVAKIMPEGWHLKTQRIPFLIDGVERGISNGSFYRHTPAGFINSYSGYQERLDVVQDTAQKIVGVTTEEKDGVPSHTILLDLDSLQMTDLGAGSVDHFVEDKQIVLMRQFERNARSDKVHFKAVRSLDGKVIDQVTLRPSCFRPVGEIAIGKAVVSYGFRVEEERIEARLAKEHLEGVTNREQTISTDKAQPASSLDILVPGKDIRFDSDELAGTALSASNRAVVDMLMDSTTKLDWDSQERRLRISVSEEIRKTKRCN